MDKVVGNLLTADQVAEYLKLDRETVYRKARNGQIPGIKIGKEWRFPMEGLSDWLKGLAKPQPAARAENTGGSSSGLEEAGQAKDAKHPAKRLEPGVREMLRKFRERIPGEVSTHVKEIRCFGSYARGEETRDSDLDLLVILDRDDPDLEEKIEEVAYRVMWDHDFNPLITIHFISQDHFRQLSLVDSLFYRKVNEEGIAL